MIAPFISEVRRAAHGRAGLLRRNRRYRIVDLHVAYHNPLHWPRYALMRGREDCVAVFFHRGAAERSLEALVAAIPEAVAE